MSQIPMWRGMLMASFALWLGATPAAAQLNRPAMAFELPKLDGSAFVRLSDFSNRPVLLNFWGSECPPCLKEMPLLIAESKRHPDVQFLGIAVDDRARANHFLSGLPAGYPQLIAPGAPEVLMRRFGNTVGALPYTLILNARHQPCASHLGEVDTSWMAAAISACTIADSRSGSGNDFPPTVKPKE